MKKYVHFPTRRSRVYATLPALLTSVLLLTYAPCAYSGDTSRPDNGSEFRNASAADCLLGTNANNGTPAANCNGTPNSSTVNSSGITASGQKGSAASNAALGDANAAAAAGAGANINTGAAAGVNTNSAISGVTHR